MATLVDCRFDKLRGLGYSGSTSDMLREWLIAEGANPADGNHINDLWRSMLASKGFTGQLNDAWFDYLGSLGHTGSINDREFSFWCETGPSNGDTITITGSGFGTVAPDIIVWDSVENQPAYEGVADGQDVPVRPAVPTALYEYMDNNPMKLATAGAFGKRGRVYTSTSDSNLGLPVGVNDITLDNKKLYVSFMIKATIDPMATGTANKLTRFWDEYSGLQRRISNSNNQTTCSIAGGGDAVQDDVRGLGRANEWFRVEAWVDAVDHQIRTRTFNINAVKINDTKVEITNPAANGFILRLFGYDDGNGEVVGQTFWYSDLYVAKSRYRVDLCSSPNWKRALYREIQQITSVADDQVQFTLDAQQIDEKNCWAVLIDTDDDTALAVHQIGNPTEILQDMRYVVSTDTQRALRLSSFYQSTGVFRFEIDFLIIPGSCTRFRLSYEDFNDRVDYDVTTQAWIVRIGGSSTFNAAATADFADGEWHKVILEFDPVPRSYVLSVADEDGLNPVIQSSETGIGGSQPFGVYNFGLASGATQSICGAVKELKLSDASQANSHYLKLDEQINAHIYDYEQDRDQNILNGNFTEFDYLPGEGYI